MNYKGKLYGKIGNKFFDTGKTSDDYDHLLIENKALRDALESARREGFEAAREEGGEPVLHRGGYELPYVYPTFEDYINSLK